MNSTPHLPELLSEQGYPGRTAVSLPDDDFPRDSIPEKWRAEPSPDLPELTKLQVVRHYTLLSRLNMSIDENLYPLGSCTMKFNPRVNEYIAGLEGFRDLHPEVAIEHCQGLFRVLFELEESLKILTGLDGITLQPAAGAHGELTGLLIAAAFFRHRNLRKTKILIPDTAHGTNPASAARTGFRVVKIASSSRGLVDIDALKKAVDHETACLMLTNPNTLGLFEEDVLQVSDIVHNAGGLVYLDGANFNAFVGLVRPADFGIDIMHLNLHKTFSTPHGTGGPGSGPVAVRENLVDFLPLPRIIQLQDGSYGLDTRNPLSIGRIKSFLGNIPPLIKALAYIRSMGSNGLAHGSRTAVLNANYLLAKIQDVFSVPYGNRCMHEFVSTVRDYKDNGVRALDVAKSLLDYGFHPPTVYFPLIVEEALMFEPTETESRETLDQFAAALHRIAETAKEAPEKVRESPQKTPVKRLDEYKAARFPVLSWQKKDSVPDS